MPHPTLFIKGAPDYLFARCTKILGPDGTTKDITEQEKDRIAKLQETWSSDGQRCLVLCRRILQGINVNYELEQEEFTLNYAKEMELIG